MNLTRQGLISRIVGCGENRKNGKAEEATNDKRNAEDRLKEDRGDEKVDEEVVDEKEKDCQVNFIIILLKSKSLQLCKQHCDVVLTTTVISDMN